MTVSHWLCWRVFGDDRQSICSRAHDENWELFCRVINWIDPGHTQRSWEFYNGHDTRRHTTNH